MKYYLRATGSWCYDQTGVTFPRKISLEFKESVHRMWEHAETRWEHQFGWANQPLVFCMDVPDSRPHSRLVNAVLEYIITPIRDRGILPHLIWNNYWGDQWESIRKDQLP